MTVGKLREELEGVPDDQKVVLSSDPEGNRYWGVADVYTHQLWNEDYIIYPDDASDIDEDAVESVTYIAPKHTTP